MRRRIPRNKVMIAKVPAVLRKSIIKVSRLYKMRIRIFSEPLGLPRAHQRECWSVGFGRRLPDVAPGWMTPLSTVPEPHVRFISFVFAVMFSSARASGLGGPVVEPACGIPPQTDVCPAPTRSRDNGRFQWQVHSASDFGQRKERGDEAEELSQLGRRREGNGQNGK